MPLLDQCLVDYQSSDDDCDTDEKKKHNSDADVLSFGESNGDQLKSNVETNVIMTEEADDSKLSAKPNLGTDVVRVDKLDDYKNKKKSLSESDAMIAIKKYDDENGEKPNIDSDVTMVDETIDDSHEKEVSESNAKISCGKCEDNKNIFSDDNMRTIEEDNRNEKYGIESDTEVKRSSSEINVLDKDKVDEENQVVGNKRKIDQVDEKNENKNAADNSFMKSSSEEEVLSRESCEPSSKKHLNSSVSDNKELTQGNRAETENKGREKAQDDEKEEKMENKDQPPTKNNTELNFKTGVSGITPNKETKNNLELDFASEIRRLKMAATLQKRYLLPELPGLLVHPNPEGNERCVVFLLFY